MSATPPRPLTIAHDYFTQRGGAERVAAVLIDVLDPDRVVTGLHNPDQSFRFQSGAPVHASFLQSLAVLRRDPRPAFPLFPLAWRLLRPVTDGVLLCSSSGWSHQLRVRGRAKKVVYCHNPARWLYQPEDYLRDKNLLVRAAAATLRPLLVRLDKRAAGTASAYIANSTSVAARIHAVYGIDARVIHPPVTIDPGGTQEPVSLPWDEFFLTVGRGRGYKNTGLLIEAFSRMPDRHLVVVGADHDSDSLPPNVHNVPSAGDGQLRWLYARATALMSVAQEDFGLTPLEANAMGTPALVLRAGGFLDSLKEGVSGRYVDRATVEAIQEAVERFPREWDRGAVRAHADRFALPRFLEQLDDVLRAAAVPAEPDARPTATRLLHDAAAQ